MLAIDDNSAPKKSPRATTDIPLLRALNLAQTTFLGVGTAIGGVMFAIMGTAARAAGPGIVITFLIGAVIALILGLCYAELGSSVPSGAGGAIAYVGRAFGKKPPTFIAGWFSWVSCITDCAVGSIVFAFAVNYFLNWVEPFTLAVITLVVFAFVNFRGTKSMSLIQFILTAVLVVTLCVFMGGSSLTFQGSQFQPLFPQGVLPVFAMISFIFPAYAGYESITQMSEEIHTAGKTIPRALILTLSIITLLFVGSVVAMIGGAPPEVYINSSTPLQDAATYFMGPIGGIIVSVASIVAALTTVNGAMAGGTRIAFALSRNDFLPSIFKRVHPKYRMPFAALALTVLLAVAFVLTRSVDFIVYAITLGYSVTAIMVALSLIRLHKTEPNLYRPFKVPLYPYLPIVSIIILIFMITTLSFQSLMLGAAFGGIGLLVMYVVKRAKQKQPKPANGDQPD